jgi:hypothetical protein
MAVIPASLAFIFDPGETPWSALPDPGPTPTVAPQTSIMRIFNNFSVESFETFFASDGPQALFISADPIDFSNAGILWNQDSGGSGFTQAFASIQTHIVENSGLIVTIGKDTECYPVYFASFGALNNSGSIISVSNHARAIGFFSFSGLYWLTGEGNTNSGTIESWSGTLSAFGVLLSTGTLFDNSGIIRASGFTDSAAIHATGISIIANSGSISAVAPASISSYGVRFSGVDLSLVNSGQITADVAIQAQGSSLHLLSVTNAASGVSTGDVILNSKASVANAGLIVGNVTFGADNDMIDSVTGRISGIVNMGGGDDTAIGGVGADFDYAALVVQAARAGGVGLLDYAGGGVERHVRAVSVFANTAESVDGGVKLSGNRSANQPAVGATA